MPGHDVGGLLLRLRVLNRLPDAAGACRHVDVLDPLAEIPFCVDYKYKGSILREYPADIDDLTDQRVVGFSESPDNVSYPLAAPRVRVLSRQAPGRVHWCAVRKNLR